MSRSPPKSTVDDIARPVLPESSGHKSPCPPAVVECWILMVATMDRVRLDKFTRGTWKKIDAKDLEPLKWAIIRRRRTLAMQLRP